MMMTMKVIISNSGGWRNSGWRAHPRMKDIEHHEYDIDEYFNRINRNVITFKPRNVISIINRIL